LTRLAPLTLPIAIAVAMGCTATVTPEESPGGAGSPASGAGGKGATAGSAGATLVGGAGGGSGGTAQSGAGGVGVGGAVQGGVGGLGTGGGVAGGTQGGTAGLGGSGALGGSGGTTGGAAPGGSGGAGGSAAGSGGASTGGGAGTASGGAGGSAGQTGTPGTCQPGCGSHKWACWPMPNPVGSGLPNEASYTDQGDTVLDDLTCLTWQKSPPSTTYVWQDAIDYCEGLSLGGHDDWRLPTRVEMASIVDFTKGPAIDTTAFPGASGAFHKTSSDWILTIEQRGAGAGKDFAWAYNTGDGIVSNAYSKATAARLRCVRSDGAGEGPSEPAVAPPNLYTEVAAGEIRDNYTGLVWQQGYSDAGMPFADAAAYCLTLALGGNTWRLPSVRELATLVDEARVAPSINVTMFPDTQYGSRSNDWYWASHLARNSQTAAWALNFDDGFTGTNVGSSGDWNYFTAGWVKCVR